MFFKNCEINNYTQVTLPKCPLPNTAISLKSWSDRGPFFCLLERETYHTYTHIYFGYSNTEQEKKRLIFIVHCIRTIKVNIKKKAHKNDDIENKCMCVPANRWGSDRALWGEVWGREGLNDGHSLLTGDVRGKRHTYRKYKNMQRDETKRDGSQTNAMTTMMLPLTRDRCSCPEV